MYLRSVTVGFVSTNCYFLGDEDTHTAAVIDPGDSGEQLCDLLRQEGYTPAMILLTHGHFDHVDGVPGFLAASGPIPVYINRRDYPVSPTNFHVSFIGEDGLKGVDNVRFLSEGDTVSLGSHTIRVLETPGHTPGGLTYQAEELLFTGDTLFAGSCGRTDFAASDPQAMLASLGKLGRLEGDYTVLPGHGPASTLEQERRSNPYLRQALGT
ncbi:MAG: MBL fold metallo-hydrolase [Clostridiales bacterium]|nr:MBL fold metallo-hydrolase [Clostridiales bacterium]